MICGLQGTLKGPLKMVCSRSFNEMGKCSPNNASEKDKLYAQCDLHFLSTSEKGLGKKYAPNIISAGGNTDSFKTSDFAVRVYYQPE